jgi:hypothetical protein
MRLARRLGARLLTRPGHDPGGRQRNVLPGPAQARQPGHDGVEADIVPGMTPDQASAATRVAVWIPARAAPPRQYLAYTSQLAYLNLGQSITYEGVPVAHIVAAGGRSPTCPEIADDSEKCQTVVLGSN